MSRSVSNRKLAEVIAAITKTHLPEKTKAELIASWKVEHGGSPGALQAVADILAMPRSITCSPQDAFVTNLWMRGFKIVPLPSEA